MASKHTSNLLSLACMLVIVVASKAAVEPSHPIDAVRRSSFPKGFVFGSSSSAYQYEGAAFKYGKGPSIWDTYTHQHPERIADGSNGDRAADSYHRYKEDVAIMKRIGFDAYRFSISWPRLLPKGKLSGGVNTQGIVYYNNLINELLAHGIKPYVTLFHWDLPQALQDEYQGFMDDRIINDFRDYAELCFKEFGNKVKHWITFNEQYIFITNGYVFGQFAPGRCSSWQPFNCLGGDSATEPYIVGHNQILAHAAAVNVYKTKYQAHQKGEIGVTLFSNWYVPYSDAKEDKEATSRAFDFSLGWFLHPLVYGDYPTSMRTLVKERLPKFTNEQRILITNSYDFIGINYYTANYAKFDANATSGNTSYVNDIRATLSTDRDGVSIGPKVNASSWLAAYPVGLKNLMIYIKDVYKNPIIYITENGSLDFDSPHVDKLLRDFFRIKYYHNHLKNLRDAITAGVRVKSYFAWSLLDVFEWSSGFTVRFGVVYIDYKHNLTRIAKDSSKWLHNFLIT
ncbi:beta-glucosidase 12-like [Cucurbita moschata]|uniref:Beta-glucosidase 12-like n=1 Tax=Cucurbita moschata TaxID=3662 RepID=A0A6J1H8A0_CUCMO|nr:beta-glucosidase 12-like [Cucurbita moschata]XP_022960678.1 beta-glucosidase 12-like [Cucurbita moschata]